MAARKSIGIVFSDQNGTWTGGTYYILNLIKSLTLLKEEEQPLLIIFTDTEEEYKLIFETGYPYIKKHNELNVLLKKDTFDSYFVLKLINKIGKILIGRRIFESRPTKKDISFIFPINGGPYFQLPGSSHYDSFYFGLIPKVFWIPDFQDRYLPEFFPQEQLTGRIENQKLISAQTELIVFSSKDAENDFKKFYPRYISKTCVLNFAVFHPPYEKIEIEQLKQKYQIAGLYFFAPNQFWQHKNHMVLLKAILNLKSEGIEILVVFTGKELDTRNPEYISSLKDFVKKENISDNVRFAGFLERSDQLRLMQGAIAVIQPSLFEGWSTVIEDAKAMSQYVIASDIKVHREQIDQNVSFFTPTNPEDLSNAIKNILNNPVKRIKIDYNQNIKKFASDFYKVLKSF